LDAHSGDVCDLSDKDQLHPAFVFAISAVQVSTVKLATREQDLHFAVSFRIRLCRVADANHLAFG
jgi:hypothetical protein